MLSDLARVCWTCEIRYPSAAAACPRCARPPSLAAVGGEPAAAWRRALAGVRPVRDALLWIPAAAVFLVALGSALSFAPAAAAGTWADGGALMVLILVLGAIAVFVGTVMGALVLWLPWAIVVAGSAWAFRRKAARRRVRTAHFPPPAAPGSWLGRLVEWRADRSGKGLWQLAARAFAVLLAIELVCDLISPKPFFVGKTFGDAITDAAIFVAAQAFALAMLLILLGMAVAAMSYVAKRLRLLLLALRERRALEALSDFERARPALTADRDSADGPARPLDERMLSAPLSGESCLAFRLRGRTARFEIDDSDASPFVVSLDDESEVAVRSERVVVALPTPRAERVELGPAQRERLERFFQSRGLPGPEGELELGESVLRAGDEVVVHGAASSEAVAGAGYREHGRRRVLCAEDGLPILIELAAE
jgi:hypothetical protein